MPDIEEQNPQSGGSYVRDPKTGALIRAPLPEAAPAAPAAPEQPASEKD